MNMQTIVKPDTARPVLVKRDPTTPALMVKGDDVIVIKAGVSFAGHTFKKETVVKLANSVPAYVPGTDYGVTVDGGVATAWPASQPPVGANVIGGFHFAPGHNASARKGGDDIPAINPDSIWDVNFRPSCPDPRGMALGFADGRPFWFDIYLCGVGHTANGTSRFNVTIADGLSRPVDPTTGQPYARFNYAAAVAVLAQHGKQVPSHAEFIALAHGVTEKTSHSGDPKVTKWDAPRVSQCGANQATGNLWIWGHDGDPDEPRASLFGGSWWDDGRAGSRYADVDYWPDNSLELIGARGRSDHLIHVEPSRQRRRRSR